MKRPAVFFDRDNTLIVSDGYLGDPAKVVLVRGAAEAVARARRLGFAVVVFSNQSGVARGMFSEEDVQAVNARMDELLAAENPAAVIDRHEFCPFHPDGTIDIYARESDRRKPKPGMIHSAAKMLALDISRSWVVGDAGRDIEAGKAAGCRSIFFADASMKKSPAAQETPAVEPDYTVSTLGEAIDFIERNQDAAAATPVAAAAQTAPAATRAAVSFAPSTNTPKTEMPPPASSVAPAVALSVAATAPALASPPAEANAPVESEPKASPAAATARVPKVAIGSKYVPPEGRETAPYDDVPERPVTKKKRPDDDARPPEPPPTSTERMESLLEQILLDLRRQNEHGDTDFSVSKLLAGLVQVIVLAVLFLAYLRRDGGAVQTYLMVAMVLQTLTISLLVMSRQK